MFGWFRKKEDVEYNDNAADEDLDKLTKLLKTVQLENLDVDESIDFQLGDENFEENISDSEVLNELTAMERGTASASSSAKKAPHPGTAKDVKSTLTQSINTNTTVALPPSTSPPDMLKYANSLMSSVTVDIDEPIDVTIDENDPELLQELCALNGGEPLVDAVTQMSLSEDSPPKQSQAMHSSQETRPKSIENVTQGSLETEKSKTMPTTETSKQSQKEDKTTTQHVNVDANHSLKAENVKETSSSTPMTLSQKASLLNSQKETFSPSTSSEMLHDSHHAPTAPLVSPLIASIRVKIGKSIQSNQPPLSPPLPVIHDTKNAPVTPSLSPNEKQPETKEKNESAKATAQKNAEKTQEKETRNHTETSQIPLEKRAPQVTTSITDNTVLPTKKPSTSTALSPQSIHLTSFIKQLKSQSDMANLAAMKFLSIDQDKALAMRWKRLSRLFAEQATVLSEWKQESTSSLSFHSENLFISYYRQCRDLEEKILEIQLGQLHFLSLPPGTASLLIQYEWSPPYEPQDPVSALKGHKMVSLLPETNVDPNIYLTLKANMDREKRVALARWCSRHKLNVEIYAVSNQTSAIRLLSFVLPTKKELVGKVSVPISVLLRQCDVHDFAEVVGPKMKRGQQGSARLDVRLRMRRPIQMEEIVDEKCRWIVIDQDSHAVEITQLVEEVNGLYDKNKVKKAEETAAMEEQEKKGKEPALAVTVGKDASVETSRRPTQKQPIQQTIPTVADKAVKSAPRMTTMAVSGQEGPVVEKKKKENETAKADDEVDDENSDMEDLYDVGNAVSNDVLEWIKEITEKELAMGKQQQSKNFNAENLEGRLSDVEGRLISLQMQVQGGILTLENYLAIVEKRIHDDGQLFLKAKKEGNLEKAKILMNYIRIMKAEVKGAREAMQS